VESLVRKSTNLMATPNSTIVTLALTNTDSIPAGTVLKIDFPQTDTRPAEIAYYETVADDTLTTIAQKMSKAINTVPYEISSDNPTATTIRITGG
jgi:hypothetical protein